MPDDNLKKWDRKLTDEEYDITHNKATEEPFTGIYWDHKGKGVYRCVNCGKELFSSKTKYDSGSGWPSFWEPIKEADIGKAIDTSIKGRQRMEVTCNSCGAHLGHVFDDGPKPTSKRYCINSGALSFDEKKE